MTVKKLDDGTTYRKAHAHDHEDPNCLIEGRCELYIKIDGIRAIRNRIGSVWSRNSKPLPHLGHLRFSDAEIFRNSWNETSSILGSDTPPFEPLTQENVYELTDGNVDKRLYIGWCENPSNENLRALMEKQLLLKHEGVIVRCVKNGKITWWKIVPYKYADVKITGMKEGTGALKGTCGSIQTAYGSAGSMVKECLKDVGVPEDNLAIRRWLWVHKDLLIGSIIQVRYREMTAAGKFRFPSLVRLRKDKNEESLD